LEIVAFDHGLQMFIIISGKDINPLNPLHCSSLRIKGIGAGNKFNSISGY
jgi:hypothetical protein